MRLFGGEKMKNLMTRIGMQPGEPIDHPWLNKGIERAQKKVEERNFEIRKHLLDYDDVLNEQRSFIYHQRDEILVDENLDERVMQTARDALDDYFDEYEDNERKRGNNAKTALIDRIRMVFGLQVTAEKLDKDEILKLLEEDIKGKENLVGKANLNMFIRFQYIQMIDRKWLDQLEELEALREAVHLRSYGSKNPLTEYKIDGFDRFNEMLGNIRLEIASRVFKVKIQIAPPEDREAIARQQQRVQQTTATHSNSESASALSGERARNQAATGSPMRQAAAPKGVTLVRSTPKIGRNDPCPCGSGKKYKNCHGKNV